MQARRVDCCPIWEESLCCESGGNYFQRQSYCAFPEGKKMAKKDVQNVVDTFCTCKVDVQHDIDRDEIVLTEQSTETFLFFC